MPLRKNFLQPKSENSSKGEKILFWENNLWENLYILICTNKNFVREITLLRYVIV